MDALPVTLFDLIGDVHGRARGIDFGQLKPEFVFEGMKLVNPHAFVLEYHRRYQPQEPCPYPEWWEGFDEHRRSTLKWRLYDMPVRLSFLLASARFEFPGVSFQMITIGVEREEGYVVLTSLLTKMMKDRRLVM